MRPELVLRGVIPANLMAFDSEVEIDEENYRGHLRHLVDTPGVTGITTNAHASEVATLNRRDRRGREQPLLFRHLNDSSVLIP
jgi:dihydrodipicolinate synthase/N-acetylneuraminate lyase